MNTARVTQEAFQCGPRRARDEAEETAEQKPASELAQAAVAFFSSGGGCDSRYSPSASGPSNGPHHWGKDSGG